MLAKYCGSDFRISSVSPAFSIRRVEKVLTVYICFGFLLSLG